MISQPSSHFTFVSSSCEVITDGIIKEGINSEFKLKEYADECSKLIFPKVCEIKNCIEISIYQMIKDENGKIKVALKYIYKNYRDGILNFVKINSGNIQDGEDVFQESVLDLLLNIKNDKIKFYNADGRKAKIYTILYIYSKHKWIDTLRKYGKVLIREDEMLKEQLDNTEFENSLYSKIELNLLKSQLKEIFYDNIENPIHARVLDLYYCEYQSPKQIFELLSYYFGSEQVVKNCIFNRATPKLIEKINEKPELKRLFLELRNYI